MPTHCSTDRVRFKSLAFMDYPDYCVGSNGSVWSRAKSKSVWRRLTPTPRSGGHLQVMLCANGWGKVFYVHKLVLTAFVGKRPKGMIARHFPDRNPANNHLSNLQWGTYAENKADTHVHGTDLVGERNIWAFLTEASVLSIRRKYATGRYSQERLGVIFGVTQVCVSLIVRRKNWKHI